ncbi:MAG: anti-sigma factor antagonist [Phycisphaera sp.]|nr:anti-sigma factor antagonist [Phycisphaera sp.]
MDPVEEFSVQIEPREDDIIVRLIGDATLTKGDYLQDTLWPIIEQKPKRVVIDLSRLIFVNSLGLGILLGFRKGLTRNSIPVAVAGTRDHILDVFQETRLIELFKIYDDVESALAASV